MLLTKAERDKFAQYLELEAASDAAIAEQAKKLGPHGEPLAKRNKERAAACLLVAADLRRTEDF